MYLTPHVGLNWYCMMHFGRGEPRRMMILVSWIETFISIRGVIIQMVAMN